MRFKFTVFLLALNLIAYGLIFFLNKQAEEGALNDTSLSAMIGREVIEADRIELRGKNLESPRILERDGSTWHIIEPMQWSANYFAVNRILNQLQFLEEETSFSTDDIERTGQKLADYGLEDPTLTLSIINENDTIELSIGEITEIGNNVYLLGPDKNQIYVLSREVIDGLLIDLSDLRTREIFDIPVFEVESLSLEIQQPDTSGTGALKVRLARANNGWNFEAPLNAVADPALVANTINTLTAAKVERFEPEASDPLLQGLDTPLMRVTLNGNKRRQTLLIGNREEGERGLATYYAKLEDNPTVFSVSAAPFDELQQAQEALRERNFVQFDSEALNAINLSQNGRQIRLQKIESGAWTVLESKEDDEIHPYRADKAIMDALIDGLSSIRASGFAVDSPTPTDLERLGFNDPRRTVVLSFDQAEPITIYFADTTEDNNTLYARTDKADFIYTVDRRATIRMLPLNNLYYRSRIIEKLPEAARITSLKFEAIETGTEIFKYALGSADILWPEIVADLDETEASCILMLKDAIRLMKAKSYLLDGYTDAFQVDADKSLPWVYKLSADILLPGGETPIIEKREYVFTERRSGSFQVGGSERFDTIFEIPQDLLDAIYLLTENMPEPPESTGDPVPEPESVAPLEAPSAPEEPATQTPAG
ncbi:MAG: DUF4340 domain-containing protein [Verrucomicrobiota bacterium]